MNFLVILVLVPTLVVSKFHYPRPTFLRCRESGVQCVGRDQFAYCARRAKFTILEFDTLNCPKGYVCQEGSRDPCVPDPEYLTTLPNDCNESSTTTQSNITEESSTINLEENTDPDTTEKFQTTEQAETTVFDTNPIREEQRDIDVEVDTIHCLEGGVLGGDEQETAYTYNEPGWTTSV